MSDTDNGGVEHDWKNPMRFSIGHIDIDIDEFGVEVSEIEVRPRGGNIYVHWREPDTESTRGER